MTEKLSHLDEHGHARMVDVGGKPITARTAQAEAWLRVPENEIQALRAGETPKGNVYEVARLAGIMAAKRTDELIPLCHSLPLQHVSVEFDTQSDAIRVVATVSTNAQTGVEMEALTAASVAALTLYDMLKALNKQMTIDGIRLLAKAAVA